MGDSETHIEGGRLAHINPLRNRRYNSELAIWLAVLFLGTGGIFYKNKKELTIVMLAIIGLTIFELIFEARARYLYTYVPLYIILAAAGVQKIVEKKIICIGYDL